MRLIQFIARCYDLPNAFRVLDIMDEAGGCDIERIDGLSNHWNITIKHYLPESSAKDLQNITLFKNQYKRRSRLWYKTFFHRFRYGVRILKNWI